MKEAVAILKALELMPNAQMVFALAPFVGIRPGEITGLQWKNVDLKGGTRGQAVGLARNISAAVIARIQ